MEAKVNQSGLDAEREACPSGPPGFVVWMFVGSAVLFFGSFVWSAWLVDLTLDREAWRYALSLGATVLAAPLVTLVVFWRPPAHARVPAANRGSRGSEATVPLASEMT